MEQSSLAAALAKFRDQVIKHNIPYWGLGSVVRLQDLVQGELRKVSIATILTLPA
jgi:hypothetical protein